MQEEKIGTIHCEYIKKDILNDFNSIISYTYSCNISGTEITLNIKPISMIYDTLIIHNWSVYIGKSITLELIYNRTYVNHVSERIIDEIFPDNIFTDAKYMGIPIERENTLTNIVIKSSDNIFNILQYLRYSVI
jgi:hypothetical protein